MSLILNLLNYFDHWDSFIKKEALIFIVIGIIPIILAIKYGIPTLKSYMNQRQKDKKRFKNLFFDGWIESRKINFTHQVREMKKEAYPSSQIGIPEKLKRILKDKNKNILLVGPSLSGKSHITTSVLKDLKSAYILTPEVLLVNDSKFIYEIPEINNNKIFYKIILLDNFQEYLKGDSDSIVNLINYATKKNYILWANCISIEIFDEVRSRINEKLEGFEIVKINTKLSFDEANNIAKSFNINIPTTFNGYIGEIFYNPEFIKLKYNEIKNDFISNSIIKYIKQAYLLGAFIIKDYKIEIDLIFKKCKEDEIVDNKRLLFEKLEEIQNKGFIKLLDSKYLSFESVWLNEIVEPEMKAKDFHQNWKGIIDNSVVYYTNLIKLSKNYNDAHEYYTLMKLDKIVPNKRTYTLLISLSPNYDLAVEWYNEFISLHGEHNSDKDVYRALIKKSRTYKTAQEWFKKIKKEEIDISVYSSLMDKAHNYEILIDLYNKIDKNNLENYYKKAYIFNNLIKKSPNLNVGLEHFNQIEPKSKLIYDGIIKLINEKCEKNEKFDKALIFYNKMLKENLKLDITLYNILFNMAPNYSSALNLLIEMKNQKDSDNNDIYPNNKTYNIFIKKSNEDISLIKSFEEYLKINYPSISLSSTPNPQNRN